MNIIHRKLLDQMKLQALNHVSFVRSPTSSQMILEKYPDRSHIIVETLDQIPRQEWKEIEDIADIASCKHVCVEMLHNNPQRNNLGLIPCSIRAAAWFDPAFLAELEAYYCPA